MDLNIITEPFSRTLYGRSVTSPNLNYAEAGMPLMEAMFGEIEKKELSHKGIVHWVYDGQGGLFVGLELHGDPPTKTILERRELHLPKYAHYKHIGSYSKLGKTHDEIHKELQARGVPTSPPYVEVYSHWEEDESKLETDILVGIRE